MYYPANIQIRMLLVVSVLAASCTNRQSVVPQQLKGKEVLVQFGQYDILHIRPECAYVQDALEQCDKLFLPDTTSMYLFEYVESLRKGEPYKTVTRDSSSFAFTDYPDIQLAYMRNDTVLYLINETVGRFQGYERREYTSRFNSFCRDIEEYLKLYKQRVKVSDFYQLANVLFPRDLFPWYEQDGKKVRMKYISHDFGKKLFQSDTIYFVDIKIPDGGLEVVVTEDTILNYPLYTLQDYVLPLQEYPIKRGRLFNDSRNLSTHQITEWLSVLYPKGIGYITKATRNNEEFFYSREIFLLKSDN